MKYFLDTKTFHKVKFVYPKNKESVELMRQYFDEENLPTDFGGKAVLTYDYEEFSRQMVLDDAKAAALWGSNEKLNHPTNGYSGAVAAPEPPSLAPPASWTESAYFPSDVLRTRKFSKCLEDFFFFLVI